MRVAFTLIRSTSWTGGYNYLLNLFRAIRRCNIDQIQPILFCGEDAPEKDLQPFKALDGVEVICSPVFSPQNKTVNILRALLVGVDNNALRLFRLYKVDVVFESATFYGWRFPLPIISWLPDFQHRHMRGYFGFLAYWRREMGFRVQVASGRTLMLSSEDARKDCECFYPKATGHTTVVRFATPIPEDLIEVNPEQVLQEYRLPSQFIYLPNQFWKHKNHELVINALAILKKQGVEVVVAASGNPLDPRHPGYIEHLKGRIVELGLQDNFRFLGLVPRRHVISLMRTCSALINPSLFEGWSSTVEEARTLGVPMVLSDIGVHREQMGAAASYFDPKDAAELALKLQNVITATPGGRDVRELSAEGGKRTCRFAEEFVMAVDKAQ